jgi:hypothetical protein
MFKPYLLFALAAFSVVASAEDGREATAIVQSRVAAFQAAQNTCKYLFLSNSGLAGNLIKATDASLSDVCECAAMLTVANRTDEQIAALVTAKNMADVLQSDAKDHALTCMRD